MSNDTDKKAKKDEEWKSNPKITMRLKKSDENDWSANEDIVMEIQETEQQPEETSDNSK